MLPAIPIPNEVASGPDSLDTSAVNGVSLDSVSSDGGKIRIVMSILIGNPSNVNNVTSPNSVGAIDGLGNVGSGSI